MNMNRVPFPVTLDVFDLRLEVLRSSRGSLLGHCVGLHGRRQLRQLSHRDNANPLIQILHFKTALLYERYLRRYRCLNTKGSFLISNSIYQPQKVIARFKNKQKLKLNKYLGYLTLWSDRFSLIKFMPVVGKN